MVARSSINGNRLKIEQLNNFVISGRSEKEFNVLNARQFKLRDFLFMERGRIVVGKRSRATIKSYASNKQTDRLTD